MKKENTSSSILSEEREIIPELKPIGSDSKMLRPIVIYATRADYSNLVPVTLDDAKQQIIAYPSRSDLRYGDNEYSTPIALENGLLYDRRGISSNTAFLKITYSDYCSLPSDPSPVTLFEQIIDSDPLIFLAICNREYLQDTSITAIKEYIKKGLPGANIIIDKRI